MADGESVQVLVGAFRRAFADALTEDRKKRQIWEREQYPYTLGTIKQDINLARDAGLLGREEEPGLQDDFHNALQMFTDLTPEGVLVEGLRNRAGGVVNLKELYETADVRGTLWNYGFGWVSSFKGGWNIARDNIEKETNKMIENIRKMSNPVKDIVATYEYFNTKKQLDTLLNDFNYNEETKGWEYVSKPPTPKRSTFLIAKRDKKGEIVKDKDGNTILEYWGVLESTTEHPSAWPSPCGYGGYGNQIPLKEEPAIDYVRTTKMK